jgi:hypothetical protein
VGGWVVGYQGSARAPPPSQFRLDVKYCSIALLASCIARCSVSVRSLPPPPPRRLFYLFVLNILAYCGCRCFIVQAPGAGIGVVAGLVGTDASGYGGGGGAWQQQGW